MTYSKGPLRTSGPSQGKDRYDNGDYAIVEPGGVIIGEAFHHISKDGDRDAEANARLWAVAFDLLEALEASESLLKRLRVCNRDFEQEIDKACEQAHAAIAKTKGEKK